MKSKESAQRVKKLRKALGLSQEDFARLLGVALQTVNRWENGSSAPSGLADSLLESLGKIVSSGRAPDLIEEFHSGDLGAGSSKAHYRILAMAFGTQPPVPTHH